MSDMLSCFLILRKKFSSFYEHVKAGHANYKDNNRGHDLAHDVTVAQISLQISPDERTGEKAWVAALLHSMDYWVRRNKEAFEQFVTEAVSKLPPDSFDPSEIQEIVQAALRHGEKNQDDQGPVQQTLQDADRLSILMVTVLFRIGQAYQKLPAVEFSHIESKNPESTYDEPCSCLDDLRNCLSEFEPQFRLPKAKLMAQDQINTLNHVIDLIMREHESLGLIGLKL